MVDDALCHRRELLDSSPSRTFYVETKIIHPYVLLMERKMVPVGGVDKPRREVVVMQWTNPRFTDPLMHHDSFGKPIERPAATADNSAGNNAQGGGNRRSTSSNKSKNSKTAARGGNSARGGNPARGGNSARGGGSRRRNCSRSRGNDNSSRGNDDSEDNMQ